VVESKGLADYNTQVQVLVVSGDHVEVITPLDLSILICEMGKRIRLISRGCYEDLERCYM